MEYFTISDLAKREGCSRQTVLYHVKKGHLDTEKKYGLILIADNEKTKIIQRSRGVKKAEHESVKERITFLEEKILFLEKRIEEIAKQ